MPASLLRVFIVLFYLSVFEATQLWAQVLIDLPPKEPEVFSIFPLGGRRGTICEAEIRGRSLGGAYGVWFDSASLRAQVKNVEAIESEGGKASESEAGKDQAFHRVQLQVNIDPAAKLGTYALRLVTPRGISNAIPFLVNSGPVIMETQSPHLTAGQAQPVNFPVIVNGKISNPGEVDYYSFQARKGEELIFEVFSKPPVSTLTGQRGFDSQLALYELAGSWFDSNQAIRLAFNDEPISIEHQQSDEDIATNSRLVYRFDREGRYLVQVGSFLGKGGPDCTYQLQIAPTGKTSLLESEKRLVQLSHTGWRERVYDRKLELNRLQALWSRGVSLRDRREESPTPGSTSNLLSEGGPALSQNHKGKDLTTFNTSLTSVKEQEPNGTVSQASEVSVPTLIEGTIENPGDVDSFKFQVEPGQALAFEIETPMVGPPLFNPWLTVLDEEGREILTNIYKRIGRAYTFYQKTVEPKTVFTFEHGGKYSLQIRDITSRKGNSNFFYRLLVRGQVPHVGDVQVCRECRRTLGNVEEKTPIDRVNLAAGEANKLTVVADQEEGFAGSLAISVEGLPEGVETLPGTEAEPDRGAPVDEGEKERFVPKSSTTTITLIAHADAPATAIPRLIRIVGRPLMNGKLGSALLVREILLMVVSSEN